MAMISKILVTGANGQLAKTIEKNSHTKLSSAEFTFAAREELDISNREQVLSYFSENSFDYCINCAAYTNVELAETEPEDAFKINAEAVKTLAETCKENHVVLIHVSTDYVFDGSKTKPYSEEEETNPLNQYGKSKLQGEQHIKAILTDYFIIRTSWLYSAYGKNFAKTIAKKLQDNEALKIITSETGTPTSCEDLTDFILHIIENKSNAFGLYHFSATGSTTWYGFACQIAKKMDKPKLVSKIDSFPMKATRPKYSVLNNNKANNLLRKKFQWEKSVDSVVTKLLNS